MLLPSPPEPQAAVLSKRSKQGFTGGAVVKNPPAGRLGSIPGQGTKIPHAKLCGQNKQANKNTNIKLEIGRAHV